MEYGQDDKRRLLIYYDKLISEHGDENGQAQGWASNETENIRFEVFLKVGDLNNCSILDVGCGFGDFYDFLKKKKTQNFSYTGIDINPEMIKRAKEKNPEANFQVIDFGSGNFKSKFDYIFCSGALSFKITNYKEFYLAHVKKMFELSKIGVAFNMLNKENNTKPENEELYATYSIKEVRDFFLNLTSKITIHKNYLPNDFTLFLYH